MAAGATDRVRDAQDIVGLLIRDVARKSESMTPLTEDEQRAIAYRYTELQLAIDQGSSDVARKYEALCNVYRGKSHKFLYSFASARDKRHWAWRLEMYLFAEIEPQFWPTNRH
jgi:hypothetical protein